MIIFDLACLANDEHRRHFIDPKRNDGVVEWVYYNQGDLHREYIYKDRFKMSDPPIHMRFEPDYQAYNDACGGDEPVEPTIKLIKALFGWDYYDKQEDVHVWSDRKELEKEKTSQWLDKNSIYYASIKMRPIDGTSPQEQLFEKWLDHIPDGTKMVDFVFSSHKPTIEMFRKRGVFVFDCGQEK